VRVAIVGAGVVGLATAWYLADDGHDVTVIDGRDGVGQGTSFANGAQLSYSYVAPLAGPGVLPKIPPWLLRRDSPLRFYPALDAAQWRWLAAFVMACNARQSELTTRRLLALAFDSRRRMEALLAAHPIDFGHARNGKLVAHTSVDGYEAARRLVDYQRSLGCEQDALDRDACIALEPALAVEGSRLGGKLIGGIHTPSEEVGDCYRFCVALAGRLRGRGTRFVLATHVESLVRDGRGIAALRVPGGDVAADAFVLAAGAASVALARPLGIRLPVYPLKGYSLTLPVTGPSPAVSVTDFKRKVVYAPLASPEGPRLRVAGMADIAGWSDTPDPVRVRQLVAEARAAFPRATDYAAPPDTFEPWCGLRPATPKGTPVIGATPFPNLYLNAGQGALGWTLALASGAMLADVVAGRPTAVPIEGFGLEDR
jgi:D-amino-acid dehydrogenase